MPITSPGCHLYFWLPGSKSEVSKTPSLGLINLLEWLTELRETFYLLDHWFIIKGYNSGTARWKRCRGQGMGKVHGASTPSPGMPLSPQFQVFTNQKLSEPCPFGILLRLHYIAWLIKSLATGHDWLNLQPLSLPQRSGGGTERANPLITWLALL